MADTDQSQNTSWAGAEIKMQIKEHATAMDVPPEKEISLSTVILAGILIWILIFAALFSWAAFMPCSFLDFLIGKSGVDKIRAQGCDPTDPAQCSRVLQNKACSEQAPA